MNNSKIFFSIVIPTYNRANLIAATINSLLKQSYDNYELIIVDDGSTDNTEEVIKENFNDNRITYYKKTNAERAAARNYGAKIAKGDYVNFFDSDDIALPNHIGAAQELATQKNKPEWFHLGYALADEDQKIYKEMNGFKGETLNGVMHKGNLLSCNGIFIRKDIILANPFNEDRILSATEDYELWLRLTSKYPLYYNNEITSLVIEHGERSVNTINGKKLIDRLESFLNYVNQNQSLKEYYGGRINRIRLEGNSYMAIHLSKLSNFKISSIKYLFRSLAVYPAFIFNKRFYATVKNLITKWQKF